MTRFLKNRLVLCGFFLVFIFFLLAIFGRFIAPKDPLEMDITSRLSSPNLKNLLGTDHYGRDILSRLILGTRIALFISIPPVFIGGIIFGLPLGAVAGFMGKTIDNIIMRLLDSILAFHGTLLAIALSAVMGGGVIPVFIAIALHAIPGHARIIRGPVLSQKEKEYVEASRLLGESRMRILFSEILPNCLSPILVRLTLDVPRAIIIEASLSFLGLGVPPPNPSWGLMLGEAKGFLEIAPHLAIFPGIAISLAILGFNLLGDGLRDILDPRMKES